jgi:hypothetical protein
MKALWKQLTQVNRFSIRTQSGMSGDGQVKAKAGTKTLVFLESGSWNYPTNLNFYNALRWRIDFSSSLLSLEHLRFGLDKPVFLFHLKPVSASTFEAVESHVCKNDCYFGRIEMKEHSLNFTWQILGPSKNDTLFCSYHS